MYINTNLVGVVNLSVFWGFLVSQRYLGISLLNLFKKLAFRQLDLENKCLLSHNISVELFEMTKPGSLTQHFVIP